MTFYLDQKAFKSFRNSILLRTTPLLLLPLVFVLIISPPDKKTLPYLILIFLFIITYVMWKSIKRHKKAWETFQLKIEDGNIERTQEGYPKIILPFSDVLEAVEGSDGTIALIAKVRSSSIFISPAIENRSELVSLISGFTTHTIRPAKYNQVYPYVGALIGLGLMATLILSTNFYVIELSGVTLLGICIWGFVEIQRNKNIDKKTKRSSYVMIFLLFFIISRLVLEWIQFSKTN